MEINSVIISTVDRRPEYIHQTLASLALSWDKSKKIHLMIDGPDFKYNDFYSNYCNIHLNEKKDNISPIKRARYNFIRCLELSDYLGGFNLILEDDVLLRYNWCDKIKNINITDEAWILSLYRIQNIKSFRGYEEFRPFDLEDGCRMVWSASLGIICKPNIIRFLINFLKKNDLEFPHDIMLGGFLSYSKIKIYECVPTLIEHIGEFSSVDKNIVWKKTEEGMLRLNRSDYENKLNNS